MIFVADRLKLEEEHRARETQRLRDEEKEREQEREREREREKERREKSRRSPRASPSHHQDPPARKAPIGGARDRACSDPPRGPPPLIAPGSIPTPTAVTLPPPLHPIPPNAPQPPQVEPDMIPPHATGKNISSSSHLRLHPHTSPSHPLVPHHPHTPPSHHHPHTPPGTHHHHTHTPPSSHALAQSTHHPHTPPHPLASHHPHTPPAPPPHSLPHTPTPPSHTPPVHHTSSHPSSTPPSSLYHHTSSQQHASPVTTLQRTNSGNLTPVRSSGTSKDHPGAVSTHTTIPASSGFVRPFEDNFPQQHSSNRRSPIIPPAPSGSHSNNSPGEGNSIAKIHHPQQPQYHPAGMQPVPVTCNSQHIPAISNQDTCVVPSGRSAMTQQHRGPPTNSQSVKESNGSVLSVKPLTTVNTSENMSGPSSGLRKQMSTSPSRGGNAGCGQLEGSCVSQTMASSPTTASVVDHIGSIQQTQQSFQQPPQQPLPAMVGQMLTLPTPSSNRMSPNNIPHQPSTYPPQSSQPNLSQHQSSQILSQQQAPMHHSYMHAGVPSQQNHIQTQPTTLLNPPSQTQQPISHHHMVNSSLPSSTSSSIQPQHQSIQMVQTTTQPTTPTVSSQHANSAITYQTCMSTSPVQQQGTVNREQSAHQTPMHIMNSAPNQHQSSLNMHQGSLHTANQHHGPLLTTPTVVQNTSNSMPHQSSQNSVSHLQGPIMPINQVQGSSQTIMNSTTMCSVVPPSSGTVTLVTTNQTSSVLAPSGSGPTVAVPAVLNVPDAAKVLAAVSTNKEGSTNMSVWDYHYLSRSMSNHRVSIFVHFQSTESVY
ncbi:hypothetical protein C0J52_09441 [Blattella germanica]|nr:hypothetical protein C0J52_09441 [Blattella germanica]